MSRHQKINIKLTQENVALLVSYVAYFLWKHQSKAKDKRELEEVWNKKLTQETKDKYYSMAENTLKLLTNFDQMKSEYLKAKAQGII